MPQTASLLVFSLVNVLALNQIDGLPNQQTAQVATRYHIIWRVLSLLRFSAALSGGGVGTVMVSTLFELHS